MNKLAELQRRKAALKAQIDREQAELRLTLLELREELEPANLLKKALSGVSGGNNPSLPAPLALVADVLGKDSKWGVLIKLLTPLVLRWVTRREKTPAAPESATPPQKTVKAKVYGRLRQNISALRQRLNKSSDETT
ncbi:MAG: hypothetical protein SFV22_12985 [Saprospiraceae bacterium]|nr:hypothetical protein [Saprospiraceae bacterium]